MRPLQSTSGLARYTVPAALAVGLFAGGCTQSHTFVLRPVTMPTRLMSTSIVVAPSTVGVTPAIQTLFEKKLAEKLRPEAMVQAGAAGDLVIQYRFVLYDTGNTAARIGSGVANLAGSPFFGIGDGSLGIEATYSDSMGNILGQIVVDGPISGAFASAEGGLDSAATSIAKYAKANFVAGKVQECAAAASSGSDLAVR